MLSLINNQFVPLHHILNIEDWFMHLEYNKTPRSVYDRITSRPEAIVSVGSPSSRTHVTCIREILGRTKSYLGSRYRNRRIIKHSLLFINWPR